MRQQHQQQMIQLLLHRNPDLAEDTVSSFVRKCVRRQVEAALYLPLRRSVYRIVYTFLVDKTKRMQEAMIALRQLPSTFFTGSKHVTSAKALPATVKAFRKLLTAYLPADQGQLLIDAANAVLELHRECIQMKRDNQIEADPANSPAVKETVESLGTKPTEFSSLETNSSSKKVSEPTGCKNVASKLRGNLLRPSSMRTLKDLLLRNFKEEGEIFTSAECIGGKNLRSPPPQRLFVNSTRRAEDYTEDTKHGSFDIAGDIQAVSATAVSRLGLKYFFPSDEDNCNRSSVSSFVEDGIHTRASFDDADDATMFSGDISGHIGALSESRDNDIVGGISHRISFAKEGDGRAIDHIINQRAPGDAMTGGVSHQTNFSYRHLSAPASGKANINARSLNISRDLSCDAIFEGQDIDLLRSVVVDKPSEGALSSASYEDNTLIENEPISLVDNSVVSIRGQAIDETIDQAQRQDTISADDFLPLFTYCLVSITGSGQSYYG